LGDLAGAAGIEVKVARAACLGTAAQRRRIAIKSPPRKPAKCAGIIELLRRDAPGGEGARVVDNGSNPLEIPTLHLQTVAISLR